MKEYDKDFVEFLLEGLNSHIQLADMKINYLMELVNYYKFKSNKHLLEPIDGINHMLELLQYELNETNVEQDDEDTQSKQLRLAKQLRENRRTEKTTSETCNEEKQAMDIKEAENKVASLIRNNPKNAL